jgi:hypothetical protein
MQKDVDKINQFLTRKKQWRPPSKKKKRGKNKDLDKITYDGTTTRTNSRYFSPILLSTGN